VKSAQVTVTLVDGGTLQVRTVMRDQINYETTAKRQKPPWGTVSTDPGRWESFVTWTALRRTGQIDKPYEAFIDDIADIDFDFEEVPPTNGASGVGSSPSSP
jgi:hypothetical protein